MAGLGEASVPAAPPSDAVGPLPISEAQEELKVEPASVATETATIGMIHPPPDVLTVVDRTAHFMARHGHEFEEKILANDKGNGKFSFLKSEDPHHAFYRHRLSECRTQLRPPAQVAGP